MTGIGLEGSAAVVLEVEDEVEVDADVLEEVALDGEEAGLDGDLDGAGLAELLEQVDELPLVLRGLGDDELALELADGADGAAGVAPAVGGDGLVDEAW